MAYPKEVAGAQFCIRVSVDGVTVYGNRKAFKAFTRWMTWIANSPEREHYECHLPWHLQSKSSLQGKEPKNVWVMMDKHVRPLFGQRDRGHAGFDLNFMMVEQSDLGRLRLRRSVQKNRTRKYPR
jgi:hypothetical protein